MTVRAAARHVLLTASVTLVLLPVLSAPAVASGARDGLDDGSDPGPRFSVLETVFWFVLVPAALFVIIALLVTLPSMSRGPRYRPGLGWWAAPVWFNGPPEAEIAVRTASPTAGGGGASARW